MPRHAQRLQTTFPRFEADGRTHARACECPRCDAGFRPSEGQRDRAALRARERDRRQRAAVALERMRDRRAVRQLKLTLALEEEARATEAALSRQQAAAAALSEDAMLQRFLRLRAEGVPVWEAFARIEGRPTSAAAANEQRLPARRADW